MGDPMVKKQPKLKTETDIQLVRRNWAIAGMLLLQLSACFFVSLFPEQDLGGTRFQYSIIPFSICVGVIASQFGVFGFLFALYPSNVIVRLSLTVGGMITSICTICFGIVFWQNSWMQEAANILPWVPMLLVGAALPFLAARAFLGWTLHYENDLESDPRLTISSFLIGTGLFAFSLAILMTGPNGLIGWAIASSVIVSGVGLVMFVPLTFVLLHSKSIIKVLFAFTVVGLLPAASVVTTLISTTNANVNWVMAFTVTFSSLILAYGFFVVAFKNFDLKFTT